MTISENISLKDFSTFRTGGSARFFCIVANTDELREAVSYAIKKELPIFILGGGSNILVSDSGFPGLVIKMEIKGIQKIEAPVDEKQEVVAGAGESWDAFVGRTVEENLSGLENLSYIPGTVGAAPVQNIGAYGAEVKDRIVWVEVLDAHSLQLEIKRMTNKECEFAYRDSIFKRKEGKKYIVTRVAFSLTPFVSASENSGSILNIKYKDIQEYIKNNNVHEAGLTPHAVRDMVIEIRKKKLPDIWQADAPGTAGSFFKNPHIRKEAYEDLLKMYPELPGWKTTPSPLQGYGGEEYIKIPAAWLLDKVCGFKGYRDGPVGVYQNQALVLVNFGGATSQQVQDLAGKMFWAVKEKTGIELEREVQII